MGRNIDTFGVEILRGVHVEIADGIYALIHTGYQFLMKKLFL